MNPNNQQQTNDHELKRSHQHERQRGRAAGGERSADTEEQQPIMRSVAIVPASHQQRTLHFEPTLRHVDPGGFGHFPLKWQSPGSSPLRGISEPQLVKTAPGPLQKTLPKRSKSESAIVRKWIVEHATLEERPTDFPPLRTTRTVAGTPANVISNRISDTLQARSIKTKFSKNENLAKCRNTDFCKFTIRLYSGEEGGVMVEIQRLCGDCMSFMRDCRAILDAAEGRTEKDVHVTTSQAEKPLYLRLPVSEMAFVKRASLPEISQEEQVASVNVTADLLSSRKSDSNMLGMESLVIQTDPLKTMKSTAILASRRILCPRDPGNTSFNMHNYVMSLLIYGNEVESTAEESTSFSAFEDHNTRLRNLAMSALLNALSLVSSEDLLLRMIAPNQEWYTSVMIPKLLQDLSTAENHPHDACYAIRCLSILAKSSGDFANKMQDEGGYDALKAAEEVGTREFALLARDAESCHKILAECCV